MAEKEFTKQDAIKIQNEQIRWYSNLIKDSKKKAEFMKAIRELKKRNAKAQSPYEIPRGVEIEELYYKINLGYSDSQYQAYLSSLD